MGCSGVGGGKNLMLLMVHKLQQGHTDMAGCLCCHLQAGVSQEAVSACLQELEVSSVSQSHTHTHILPPTSPLYSLACCSLYPMSSQEERFAFLAEWYDPSAALLRRYQLLFYPRDGSVEMVSAKGLLGRGCEDGGRGVRHPSGNCVLT